MVEVMRIFVAVSAFLLIGFNMAAIANARRITAAVTAWRIFLVGITGITLAVGIYAYQKLERGAPVGFLTYMATVSMIITIVGLAEMQREFAKIPYGRREGDYPQRRRDDAIPECDCSTKDRVINWFRRK